MSLTVRLQDRHRPTSKTLHAGLFDMALKNLGFLGLKKTLKSPNLGFLGLKK